MDWRLYSHYLARVFSVPPSSELITKHLPYSLNFFAPTVISSLGYSDLFVQLFTVPAMLIIGGFLKTTNSKIRYVILCFAALRFFPFSFMAYSEFTHHNLCNACRTDDLFVRCY